MSRRCSASISATIWPAGAAGTTSARRRPTRSLPRSIPMRRVSPSRCIGRQIHSPLDLERRFGLIGGDIFHGKMGLDQLFSARPMIGAADYRMPLKGLYLCGSGAHPGGGVTGAPGHNAAQAVLADRRFWKRAHVTKPLDGIRGPRPEPRAGGAVVHAIARRPRRRGHQDRTARQSATTRATGARRGMARASERVAAYFLSCNRGKKSAAIDFADREGAALVRKLAAQGRRGGREFQGRRPRRNSGSTRTALRAANPRLIYASITGFGQDGPYADRAGYDFIIQGMGGLMSITGLPDGEPGGGPMRVGVAVADLFTGMYTASRDPRRAVPAREDGRGRAHRHGAVRHAAGDARQPGVERAGLRARTRRGRAIPTRTSCPTNRSMRPISRSSSRSATTGSSRRLAEMCGHPEWAGDERFATNAARVANRARDRAAGRRVPFVTSRQPNGSSSSKRPAFPPGRSIR